jgi:O-methyltransferase
MINNATQDRYLDLLKNVLTDFNRISSIDYVPFLKRNGILVFLLKPFLRLLNFFNYDFVQIRKYSVDKRIEGEDWPLHAESMIGLKRMNNLQYCISEICKDNIEGDLIETGVWRGGASIFMKANLIAAGDTKRKVFVCDSFKGLPAPDPHIPQDKGDWLHTMSYLAVSKNDVMENFKKYKVLDDNVVFVEGWFKDTLPSLRSNKFSLLRLDGDMYQSTMDALTNLYSGLSKGGFIIIDDWTLNGCKQAVLDFRNNMNINDEIIAIDALSMYWRKTQ